MNIIDPWCKNTSENKFLTITIFGCHVVVSSFGGCVCVMCWCYIICGVFQEDAMFRCHLHGLGFHVEESYVTEASFRWSCDVNFMLGAWYLNHGFDSMNGAWYFKRLNLITVYTCFLQYAVSSVLDINYWVSIQSAWYLPLRQDFNSCTVYSTVQCTVL